MASAMTMVLELAVPLLSFGVDRQFSWPMHFYRLGGGYPVDELVVSKDLRSDVV